MTEACLAGLHSHTKLLLALVLVISALLTAGVIEAGRPKREGHPREPRTPARDALLLWGGCLLAYGWVTVIAINLARREFCG